MDDTSLPPATVLGLALRGVEQGGPPPRIERDDGLVNEIDVSGWLDWSLSPDPLDATLLAAVSGDTLLDVGCGTGRFVHHLQADGIRARGVDECEVAISIARERGLSACMVGDIWSDKVLASLRDYDVIALFGQSVGIAGKLSRLGEFLARLSSMLKDGGRILLTSDDFTLPNHGGYPELQRSRGSYPGDARLRIRWSSHTSDWFDWLFVDPGMLDRLSRAVGLTCSLLGREQGRSMYAAVLAKG